MKVFGSVQELAAAVGTVFGPGDALLVDQARINAFADATEDHQWIHIDTERAASGPFGHTIAHGYLTMSLLPPLMKSLFRTEGLRMTINYGMNRLRFPSPLPAGSRVSAQSELLSVQEDKGSWNVVQKVTVTAEGAQKPCCVAEVVSKLYPE